MSISHTVFPLAMWLTRRHSLCLTLDGREMGTWCSRRCEHHPDNAWPRWGFSKPPVTIWG